MQRKQIEKIAISAVMAALYVGLDYLAVSVSAPFGGTMKLSIAGLTVIIVAALFGAVWGAATGFVGAFVGQMITYGFTATTVLWCLPALFRGITFGLIFLMMKKNTKPWALLVPTVISSLIVTAINTCVMYIDAKIYHYPVVLFGISLVNRILAGVITAIVFAIILPPIINGVKKVVKG